MIKSKNYRNKYHENGIIPQKSTNFVAKLKIMGANSSYKVMYDIIEQSKDGTIFIPDDLYGTPDAVRNKLCIFSSAMISILQLILIPFKTLLHQLFGQ